MRKRTIRTGYIELDRSEVDAAILYWLEKEHNIYAKRVKELNSAVAEVVSWVEEEEGVESKGTVELQ